MMLRPLMMFGLVALISLVAGTAAGRTSFSPEVTDTRHYPSHSRGIGHDRPYLDALRVADGILSLDGRLDDRAWTDAPAGWGFVEHEPDRGRPASEETVFKVLYDDEAIYFGIACFEKDPSRTSSALSRRDQLQNSDMISIYIDPYHDYTTGYNFRVNPDGVQADHYIFADGERDPDWNAVWQAETSRDDSGWYAEVRIPFSAIRYRPEEKMTWGLQVYRWMHARGEDTGWANWERHESGFVSRWGELRGLQDVPAPRRLEVAPYAVGRVTDPDAPGRGDALDHFGNVGVDFKYGLTADLTLNATIQPDFGQVEADPAVLNLGPFETSFQEKRPFFVEGAQAFQHPHFNMFYSRRIGAGGENTRIRFAGKLIGKTARDISIATLFASTDEPRDGRAHNPLAPGNHTTHYALTRIGKEFSEGRHRVNLMQTAVLRDATLRQTANDDPRRSRDAYSSGADFEWNSRERSYRIDGSFVATVVDEAPLAGTDTVDPAATVGTGGFLRAGKTSGAWRGEAATRWESADLDANDIGQIPNPDRYISSFWLQRRLDPGEGSFLSNGNMNFNVYRKWFFSGNELRSVDDEAVFQYGAGKPQSAGGNFNGWLETRQRWQLWYGGWGQTRGHSKYLTRWFEGRRGPLMSTPPAWGAWAGFNTDWRKPFVLGSEVEMYWDDLGERSFRQNTTVRWVQNARMNHRVSLGFSAQHDDAQWVGNYRAVDGQPSIGGVSNVFGELDNRTLDITLRSNFLFTRSQSLEVYVQPFLATGCYSNARALRRTDTHDLGSIDAVLERDETDGNWVPRDFDIGREDFRIGSVNANLVYRWEYRPGSSLFLVWTHRRTSAETRGTSRDGATFGPEFDRDVLFRNEPINTFLVKVSYWFSL